MSRVTLRKPLVCIQLLTTRPVVVLMPAVKKSKNNDCGTYLSSTAQPSGLVSWENWNTTQAIVVPDRFGLTDVVEGEGVFLQVSGP